MTAGGSFTGRVKRELSVLETADARARRAELAGLVRSAGTLRLRQEGPALDLATEEAAVARKALRLLKQDVQVRPRVLVRLRRRLRRGNVYTVRVDDPEEARRVLEAAGILRRDGGGGRGLPRGILRSRPARLAFLRGCFLGCGHVHPPERGYHVEFFLRDRDSAEGVRDLLRDLGLPAGLAARQDGFAVYLKEGDAIATLLGMLGAHAAVLAFEETRVLRDLRGRVNRLTNAETANLHKAALAAAEQLADIRALAESGALERLPPSLRELARARLEHPELSLRELGQQVDPPLSKSAVAHRMRRLREAAERARSRLQASGPRQDRERGLASRESENGSRNPDSQPR